MPVPPIPIAQGPVVAKSAVVIEDQTGKVLWTKDPNTPRYPASTTKILTCLLLLENRKPADLITAPADVTKVRESSMNLKPGEKVSAKSLSYALMLRSANDGCYAVAVDLDGSVQAFSQRMNKRAAEIGCKNTQFSNPNGLNDPNHKTTAFDLAMIGREAMKRADFREVVRTKRKVIDRSINVKDRLMVNRNKFLWKDPGADGIKTGWTIPSGHTYVGSVKRDNFRVITSILDSKSWQKDHAYLVNWAFNRYRVELVKKAGPVDESELGGGVPENLKCTLEIKKPAFACVKKDSDRIEFRFETNKDTPRPYKTGAEIGKWVVTDSENFEQRFPVFATSNEPELSVAQKVNQSKLLPVTGAVIGIAGLITAGTLLLRGKGRSLRY
jgi:D-alanyl-D-alanine carboxypeptidase